MQNHFFENVQNIKFVFLAKAEKTNRLTNNSYFEVKVMPYNVYEFLEIVVFTII